ncbi:hypothetical protein RNJ44_00912 [Nakaseomyces bracarensis]|uniref:AP complex subunit beta n=1 Tax=Nakaseomyces bracarensis TaxID=273131 RepID=A0ABR4NQE2_9SACH
MSDQRVFSRYKASEIGPELQNFEVNKFKTNSIKRKNALRKIIANLTIGNYNEMAMLEPEIMKFWAIDDDFEVKNICHEYVCVIGSMKPRLIADSMSHIQNDLKSRDEEIQMLALRTLLSVPSSDFLNEAFRYTSSIITRRNNVGEDLVKSCISAMVQLDEMDHERVLPLIRSLFEICDNRHESISIRVAALHTLHTIHEKNVHMKNLDISVDMALNILENLDKANEWDKALVIETLPISVIPQSHDDAYDLIDVVIPQLQNVNTYVALNTLKFIMYLLNYVETVADVVIKRISNSIVALLDNPAEIQFLILRNVILLLLSRGPELLNLDISYFFIQYNDPIYVKDTKLECLYLLADQQNLYQILEELEQYATDIDIQMSRKAIRAIGNLAVKLDEDSASECCETLLHLLDFGVDFVLQEIISVFKNILRKYPDRFKSYVSELIKYIDIVQEPESINAMIWIITYYANDIPNYLEVFKPFATSIKSQPLEIQFSILSSSVKMFLRNPSEKTETSCMQVLKFCTEDNNNIDLRNRAFFYWRLLALTKPESGPNKMSYESISEIIDGELPMLELNTKLDPAILEELELNIGSIVSIYLKPVAQIFRQNKTKSLPKNNILNTDREHLKIMSSNNNFSIPENAEVEDYFSPRMSGPHKVNSNRSGSLPGTPMSNSSGNRKTMADYDRPAEKVNQLSGKRKTSTSTTMKLARKPTGLLRKMSLKKKPF